MEVLKMADFFLKLHKMAMQNPEEFEVVVDENGELEIEIDYDFFMSNIKNILGGEEKEKKDKEEG